jgi:hypothetical protein
MGSQLISFPLRDEEVALLMQHANSEENPSLTAQRLIRKLLSTPELPPNALSSLLTQVSEFQDQVESLKGCVDEAIDQRLEAVDNVVSVAVNQQMKAELLQIRSHFEQMDRRLDKYFQIQRASVRPSASSTEQAKLPTAPFNALELARRLINPKTGHPYSQNAITRQKDKANFPEWSKLRDPQGVAWEYDTSNGLFYPLQQNARSTKERG